MREKELKELLKFAEENGYKDEKRYILKISYKQK